MQNLEQKIWDLIEAGVIDLGLRLVRVQLSGKEDTSTLQIMIEPTSSTPQMRTSVSVDDCAKVSRMVSALMDVEDPIETTYNLEVSSTGMNRPLVIKDDFINYTGSKVKIAMADAINGQKNFKGTLQGLERGSILLKTESGEVIELPYNSLHSAKLTFTQQEINEFMKTAS